MMKRMIWAVVGVLLAILIVFIANPYLIKLIKCDLPEIDNYKCSPYKTIPKPDLTFALEKSPLAASVNISDSIIKQMQLYKTSAFIVIQDGKILYEKYFSISDTDKIKSFSVAKSILSLLIGIAIDRGFIPSVAQKIKPYFPDMDLSDSITIRDLLTMSSGLKWNENFDNPFSDVVKAFYTDNLKPLINKTKSVYPPGKQFSYKCINSILLGQILEKASGMSVTDFAYKYLWQPLGSESDALWSTDKNGIVKVFCCFYATPRDYARLGMLILNGGVINGNVIVSKDYLDQMISPALYLRDNTGDSVYYYGYHIWITRYRGLTIPYMQGMFGQYVFIIPEKNAVVVRLGEKRSRQMVHHTPIDVEIYLNAAFDILN